MTWNMDPQPRARYPTPGQTGRSAITQEFMPMRCVNVIALVLFLRISTCSADEPPAIVQPNAFKTLVNPACSHCRDEAKRRNDLKADDSILAWIRGYSDGGAIPMRFFLAPYRV